jgi:hypothetical protein
MFQMLLRGVVALLAVVLLVPLQSLPANADPGTTTYVSAHSDQLDEVGRGHDWLLRGAEHVTVRRSASGNQLQVTATSGGPDEGELYLDFGLTSGETLRPGKYDVFADRTSGAGLNISGDLVNRSTLEACSSPITGSFEVKDIVADYSRFWITYEQHCDGQTPAMFGEIKYQEPAADSELLVAPTEVTWPAAYPGVPARRVPVTLVNTGSAPVEVSKAAITEGSAEFSMVGNTCGAIAPGDSCAIEVSYVAKPGAGHAGRLTIEDSTSTGQHAVPLSGSVIPGHTSWRLHSQEQEYLGMGRDYSHTPSNSVTYVAAGPGWVSLGLQEGGGWGVRFTAPYGQELRPGATYTGAADFITDLTKPGLRVSGPGGGCSTTTGRFRIRDVSMSHGALRSFAATFVYHCEDDEPAVAGSVAWHADTPADPVPSLTKMAPQLSLAPVLTVVDGERARVAGRIWHGDAIPWLPDKLVHVYARPHAGGRWQEVGSVKTDDQGSYRLRFPLHRSTDYQARFRGSRDLLPVTSPVRVALARWRVTLARAGNAPGHEVRLRCAVVHGRRNQVVVLQRQDPTTGRWLRVDTRRLNARGNAVFTVKRPRSLPVVGYRVVAKAGRGRIPGPSNFVHVSRSRSTS